MRKNLLMAAAFVLASNISGRADVPQQPNIVLIMSDDQGYETVGAYGGKTYRTPQLDKLAKTGMRFDQAHATPVCTPTRVKIMSGKYNSRNYIGFGQMHRDVYTFGQLFQQAGYATYIAGKWQLGHGREGPYHFGFDEYCLWQVDRRPPRYPNPGLEINGRRVDFKNGEYGPDVVTDHINDFIERHRDQPFFVYYPMILPHWPFEPTPDSPTWDPARRLDEEEERSRRYHHPRYFVDMVEYTDKMVGKVVAKLDELGLRENTLVIFTSDNGTDRGLVSEINGRKVVGGKLHSTDAGTHVPLIANWPGVVPAGSVNHDLICFTYFFPTLAEVAGIEIPSDIELDGQSIAPVFFGKDVELRDWLYMWWYRNNDPDGPGDEFARTRRYKYYVDGRFYDLEGDPLEKNPLDPDQPTDEQREVRDRLREIIARYTRPGFAPSRPAP